MQFIGSMNKNKQVQEKIIRSLIQIKILNFGEIVEFATFTVNEFRTTSKVDVF